MKYLLAINGITDERFGILASPKMGIPEGIKNGMVWAADMGALRGPSYVKRFNPDVALPWLRKMEPYKERCLWIVCPDVVGSAEETSAAFADMSTLIGDWPLAYAAQDGQELWTFPWTRWDCLFVGGTTAWKESAACASVIREAQKLGKMIHIGRVNSWRRYSLFRGMDGSEEFTCDGTKQRFCGVDAAVVSWAKYMEWPCTERMLFCPAIDQH